MERILEDPERERDRLASERARDQEAEALDDIVRDLNRRIRIAKAPDRQPSWLAQDTEMLATVGVVSRALVARLIDAAADRPKLSAALSGQILDVGVGDGSWALAAAALSPTNRVLGLDIWEPALALARSNVTASPFAGRVQLQLRDVSQIDQRDWFNLIWLPAPFLMARAATTGLDRLTLALKPDGYLVIGHHDATEDGGVDGLGALERLRSGNQRWETADLVSALRARNFTEIETLPGADEVSLILGRRR